MAMVMNWSFLLLIGELWTFDHISYFYMIIDYNNKALNHCLDHHGAKGHYSRH